MKLTIKLATVLVVILFTCLSVSAQETTSDGNEKRVSLNEVAVAHDNDNVAALQGTLRTTSLNGSPESPVTNIRLIIKKTTGTPTPLFSGAEPSTDSTGIAAGDGSFTAALVEVVNSLATAG